MSQWFVYLVRCRDHTLYCGITPNLHDRIQAHNLGKGAKYTRSRLPVELVFSQQLANRSEAAKREYQIKKMTRAQKLTLIRTSPLNDEPTRD